MEKLHQGSEKERSLERNPGGGRGTLILVLVEGESRL